VSSCNFKQFQVAAATSGALQHQLINMQREMMAVLHNPGAIQPMQELLLSPCAFQDVQFT